MGNLKRDYTNRATPATVKDDLGGSIMEEKDVLNKLKQKGFSLEVQVCESLEADGWTVTAQDYYLDQDQGKARTVDLTATKRFEFEKWFSKQPLFDFLDTTLVVECKKSVNPIVFYMTRKGALFQEEKWRAGIVKYLLSPRIAMPMIEISDRFLSKSHYYAHDITKASVNFRVLNGEDFFFESLNQVLKAFKFNFERTEHSLRTLSEGGLLFHYPIVILEGTMFEYESGEVHRTKYVQYQRQGVSRYNESFVVDVLDNTFLRDFLGILKNEHDLLRASMSRQVL